MATSKYLSRWYYCRALSETKTGRSATRQPDRPGRSRTPSSTPPDELTSDYFNECGVQIMALSYEADPGQPKLVETPASPGAHSR